MVFVLESDCLVLNYILALLASKWDGQGTLGRKNSKIDVDNFARANYNEFK